MKSEFSIDRKAFSLLELLVSITLLALVSALIYGAFFQVSNSSLRVKESLSQSQELRLLMKMVLDDLQSLQYLENFVKEKDSASETGLIA
ncbi:MAG: PulJ/GspJ family protein, partial [bacterium]